ncbi:MAG: class I SAM-dependent methyltransferase [Acidobacteriia bacterium]|nr:class I SAM-dependent methyltransferase [Terriglobia bacterium]
MHFTDRIRKLIPRAVKRAVKPLLPQILALPKDPNQYVGTDEVSGQLQLELLKREGCRPDSKALEIGCGNLHAGVMLIEHLMKGHYAGVDPNTWLRRQTLKDRRVRELVREKQARFLSVDNFDASSLGTKFDFILSHSVLSHAAHWQLEQYLRNACKVLAPGGRILASIYLAEGNAYGSSGTPGKQDSMDETWQYPGISWFKLATVVTAAGRCGLTVVYKPEYTEFYVKTRPNECHDWLVFYWKG